MRLILELGVGVGVGGGMVSVDKKRYPPYVISPAHTADASTLPERRVDNGDAFQPVTSWLPRHIAVVVMITI